MALALGKLEDSESLDMLVAAFRDPRTPEPVRQASLEAVEMIGTEKAVTALGEIISRKSVPPERQVGVIAALGRFEDPAAVPALLVRSRLRRSPCARPPSMHSSRSSSPGGAAAAVAGIARSGAIGRRHIPKSPGPFARSWPTLTGLCDARRWPPRRLSVIATPSPCCWRRRSRATRGSKPRRHSPRCPTSAPCRSIWAVWRTRAPTFAGPRRPRSPAFATRLPPCSTSSHRGTSCRPRSCPSCMPSMPAWCRSLRGRLWDRSRSVRDLRSRPRSLFDTSAGYEGAGGKKAAWRSVELADKQGQVDLGAHLRS